MTDNPDNNSTRWRLSCERLTVVRGGRAVVRELTIDFRDGECVSLIGPNGSGKTTLMLALLGLLPAESGGVRLNGRDVSTLPARERGRFASYVPQTIERLPAFSIYDVVAAGRFPHASPLRPLSEIDRRKIEAALQTCGLANLADRRVNAVSGGERQKTLIAAAIAQDARVMFLDEPNTALDPAHQIELVDLLREWHARGRGLLLISHELQLPSALGGRVIALREGRIIADGPAADVLTPERLAKVYDADFDVADTVGGRRVIVPNWWSSS